MVPPMGRDDAAAESAQIVINKMESVINKSRQDERKVIHDLIIKKVPNTVIRLYLSDVMKVICK